LNDAKRGAHAPPFLLTASDGTETLEKVYGEQNLAENEDWLMGDSQTTGVRIITAAPEVDGVMNAIGDLSKRGILFAIGHRYVSFN
jgi:N-acetylglucosamine-6-phosphate deacetylase